MTKWGLSSNTMKVQHIKLKITHQIKEIKKIIYTSNSTDPAKANCQNAVAFNNKTTQ